MIYQVMFDRALKIFGSNTNLSKPEKEMGKTVKAGLTPENKALLSKIIEAVTRKTINLYVPDSMFNAEYERLPESEKEILSQKAANIMDLLRQIEFQYSAEYIETESYTMQALLTEVREKLDEIKTYIIL